MGQLSASHAAGSVGELVGFPAAVRLVLLSHFTISVITILHCYFVFKKVICFFNLLLILSDRIYGLYLCF